ncbi:MFS transporter [Tenggerimyces flavus]|uniref:MFS transporter n=1 Tax=Tenggerimyces flavus TaxID=1708749 RepID=A0ABV7YML3_9ACTN|nr:MFS transporter [Tenggerimyces flavus]MBM7787756.1 MFS family permease [Tenggerimyces flavus]
MSPGRDLVAVYLRWIFARAVLHRGWWLVTSVYLVVESGLSPAELVFIGVAQGVISLLFEVPAGVIADTVSRRTSLIVSHVLMGTAMLATGLVTDFWLIVATQMLWGLSWTFASGADVAWLTDELDGAYGDHSHRSAAGGLTGIGSRCSDVAGGPAATDGPSAGGGRPRPPEAATPERGGWPSVSTVLVRAGRAELIGSAVGLVVIGGLGSLLPRGIAMVIAGGAMLALGLYVVLRFGERNFTPATERRWAASWQILRDGIKLVRASRAILVMFAATFLVNGADNTARLFQKRLVDLGFPSSPVLWFTLLGVLTLLVGSLVLRLVEGRVDTAGGAVRCYALACAAGVVGFAAFAFVPEELSGSAAFILVAGIAMPMTRVIGVIWVNRETTGNVRATVHSFLAQAEYLGEIVVGFGIAAVARFAGLPAALVVSAAVIVVTIGVISRARTQP